MAREVIKIKGFTEMRRAFRLADNDLAKAMNKKLRRAAEPVRADAAVRALREIPSLAVRSSSGPDWSEMRTGITSKVVYVAPARRGRRSALRRPNLAGLLMDRAMQPALDANVDKVIDELGDALDEFAREWAR